MTIRRRMNSTPPTSQWGTHSCRRTDKVVELPDPRTHPGVQAVSWMVEDMVGETIHCTDCGQVWRWECVGWANFAWRPTGWWARHLDTGWRRKP